MSYDRGEFRRPVEDPFEQPPPAIVQYFYASPIAIDDPLAPVPQPLASGSPPPNQRPRPFSELDNTLLDKAWNELRPKIEKYQVQRAEEKQRVTTISSREVPDSDTPTGSLRYADHRNISIRAKRRSSDASQSSQASTQLRSRRHLTIEGEEGESSLGKSPSRLREDHLRFVKQETDHGPHTPPSPRIFEHQVDSVGADSENQDGLTGTPFARAPVRRSIYNRRQNSASNITSRLRVEHSEDDFSAEHSGAEQPLGATTGYSLSPTTKVPVGVSRLHQVSMPDLQMEPIYWLPVHDIANVSRATWFYKETMLPVEADVANMLELGYVNLRPWTETWKDELNSAVEVGAVGEMKISHPLWPESSLRRPSSRPGTATGSRRSSDDEDSPEKRRAEAVSAACDIIGISTRNNPAVDNRAAGNLSYGKDGQKRLYRQSAIIYADASEAHILRPSLQPSSYYGRRPLANYIRKGRAIGICVVRGFDRQAWDLAHPSKIKSATAAAAVAERLSMTRVLSDPTVSKAARGDVTDLVLVVHGIGQKLSERVESFHFTHAMNGFRREFNVEMCSPFVKMNLRKDMGGMMVLPVNWRSTLSFEEGGYRDGPEEAFNHFSLKDITPDSLPSVRNIISDVMLDIPYYLSHHQPKMIAAVIKEANRIYSLWCSNNPGFQKYGRVHIIAHSLGSVMAIDILSKQPTNVNIEGQQQNGDGSENHFSFDTKNLYLCGSPAGFFLLLKKAGLVPRRDRNKPGANGEDSNPGIPAERGTYGCLAVDNVYNIVNPYDPVAYRLNATVDAEYAASLRTAFVPSASPAWFSFGSVFKSPPTLASRTPISQRLPANVELETHNFTREEIAEKRAYLLNDNGQIDYFLRYGGGPLEIQYLTMLGAHSSYWLSRDFVRFVVLETGRKMGKEGTLEHFRAAKKKAFM